jgi:tetratricopeptide (TPR) repeat protein
MNYDRICFVIMPFGKKEVIDENGQRRTVDFDPIYQNIFEPAIRDAKLPAPETGVLEPRRTDQDFFSGDISQEMFDYLEYSRMALTDITGLNPNVFYELGVRHRARQSGTTIFRQVAAKIPFDINQIKAFPYDYEPEVQALDSRALITRVLTESLAQNRIDSPVQRALAVQHTQRPQIQVDLRAAENALRVGDRPRAIAAYRQALGGDPGNNLLYMRLGLLLKDDGRWQDALEQFDKAIAAAAAYAEAYREKGIAENKLYQKAGRPAGMPNGIEALKKAVELNPDDYDAHASLAGALKREGRLADALAEYERATEVSRGHSYPLLNALKLKAQLDGKLEIDAKRRFLLKRAERSLRAQVSSDPPYDPPWSFFDLSEIRLYDGDKNEFLSYVSRGIEYATHAWQLNTFRDSLKLLPAAGIDLPGLSEAIALLEERASDLE